jgi:microcystin-dependent protein
MPRCGCSGADTCSCVVQGGSGITVDGAGTQTNPYVISGSGAAGGGSLTVSDTATVDLSLLGDGSEVDPYVLQADATVGVNSLIDVSAPTPADGYVLAWNGTVWQPVPPTTAPVGAVAVGTGLLGDGSSGDPVRLDPGSVAGFVVPTGTVTSFAGAAAPAGWLMCNATPVSRTVYADLFAVIGTTYGAGNGSTTFNVPNLVDRHAVGAGASYARGATPGNSTHSHSTPNHTHPVSGHTHTVPAHEHGLGADGRALITMESNAIYIRRTTLSSTWHSTRRIEGAVGDTGAWMSTAAELDGSTNFAGPWVTGTGGTGQTGSDGAGTTGSASTLSPSVALNYIIKT